MHRPCPEVRPRRDNLFQSHEIRLLQMLTPTKLFALCRVLQDLVSPLSILPLAFTHHSGFAALEILHSKMCQLIMSRAPLAQVRHERFRNQIARAVQARVALLGIDLAQTRADGHVRADHQHHVRKTRRCIRDFVQDGPATSISITVLLPLPVAILQA